MLWVEFSEYHESGTVGAEIALKPQHGRYVLSGQHPTANAGAENIIIYAPKLFKSCRHY
jgi:hypothetical protein